MENNENTTIVINMLKQITTTLSQNQTILFDQIKSMHKGLQLLNDKMDNQYKTLNDKMDSQYKTLNDKMDKQYKTLNDKIDRNYEENRLEHIEIRNILSSIQKDVKDLRDDVDTIYALEKDSRKTIRKLM